MFDSLVGGYIPVCVLTLAAAWMLSALKSPVLRITLSAAIALALAAAWSFAQHLMGAELRASSTLHEPWLGWALLAIVAWAAVAIPLGVVATWAFAAIRSRRRLTA
ncbi:MAG TPA: hypothetical protein VJ806_13210 [Luteimonas sp.]|nr:hypothetical protein [Luteimonas sp.]